jgi:hypothetical protein
VGIAGGFVAHALHLSFLCDDAFISFRYAWNWVEHGEIVFNLGERVEGYTNFLWVALMAGGLAAGIDPTVWSRLLGIAFGVLGILVLVRFIVRREGGGFAAANVAALLLVLSPAYAAWATGGLETQLFTLLVTLGWTRYLEETSGETPRRALSGILFGLATLTRPEGLIFMAATLLHRTAVAWFDERRVRPTRWEWGWFGGFLLPVIPHEIWRWTYYGWPLPNTYYVKVGAEGLWRSGAHYLRVWATDHSVWLLPIAFAFIPGWIRGGPRRGRSLLVLYAVLLIAHVVRVGGDFMELHRYFVPILPGLALLSALGLRGIAVRLSRSDPRAWGTAVLFLAYLSALGIRAVQVERRVDVPYSKRGIDSIRQLDIIAHVWSQVGRWLAENKPPDTSIAVNAAGAIPYYSRLTTLDVLGLNDAYIAHEVIPDGDRAGHIRSAPDEYIVERDIDLLIFHPQLDMNRPPPAGDPYWSRRGYVWKTVQIPGDRPFWFGYWEKARRNPRRGARERSARSGAVRSRGRRFVVYGPAVSARDSGCGRGPTSNQPSGDQTKPTSEVVIR